MASEGQQLFGLVEGLRSSRIVSYGAAGSTAVLVADFLHTLPDEVKYMWTRGISLPKTLFFLIRYYSFAHTAFSLIFHNTSTYTGETCVPLFIRSALSGVGIALLSELIIVVRLYAFSGNNLSVLAVVAAGTTATFALQIYFATRFAQTLEFAVYPTEARLGCLTAASQPSYLASVFISTLAGQIAPTLLMVWIAFKKKRDAGGIRGLMRLFYTDGIIYFLCISSLAIVNLIVMHTAPENLLLITFQPKVHLTTILACRMLIHLRKWGDRCTFEINTKGDTSRTRWWKGYSDEMTEDKSNLTAIRFAPRSETDSKMSDSEGTLGSV